MIFKELPIFGDNSRFAAQAALASVKQGKYYSFHDALLATANPLSKKKVLAAAKKIKLNINQLKANLTSPQIKKQLRDNFQLAQNLKIMGTPAFIVSNKEHTKFKFVPGATSQAQLQKMIDAVQ